MLGANLIPKRGGDRAGGVIRHGDHAKAVIERPHGVLNRRGAKLGSAGLIQRRSIVGQSSGAGGNGQCKDTGQTEFTQHGSGAFVEKRLEP